MSSTVASERPAFSIVMAAYNAAATIETSIRSALMQTRGDFELIVVDDGSTDDTAERVKRLATDPRVRLVQQENQGLPKTRNTAIGVSRGQYITVLDSDDLLMPTYLERIGETLEGRPDAGFAFADAYGLDHATGRFRQRTVMVHQQAPDPLPDDRLGFLAALVESNFIPIMFTARRSAIDRVGGFRVGSPLAEDHEFLLRILAFGFTAVQAPGVLGIYRRNRAGALTYDSRWMLIASREALQSLVDDHPAPEEIKERARERIAAFDELIDRAGSPTALRRALAPAKARASALKRTVVVRDGLREPPADVLAAFPELRPGTG